MTTHGCVRTERQEKRSNIKTSIPQDLSTQHMSKGRASTPTLDVKWSTSIESPGVKLFVWHVKSSRPRHCAPQLWRHLLHSLLALRRRKCWGGREVLLSVSFWWCRYFHGKKDGCNSISDEVMHAPESNYPIILSSGTSQDGSSGWDR